MSVGNQGLEPLFDFLDDQDDYHTANKIPVMHGVQGVSSYQRINDPGYYHDATRQVMLDKQVAEAGFSGKIFYELIPFFIFIFFGYLLSKNKAKKEAKRKKKEEREKRRRKKYESDYSDDESEIDPKHVDEEEGARTYVGRLTSMLQCMRPSSIIRKVGRWLNNMGANFGLCKRNKADRKRGNNKTYYRRGREALGRLRTNMSNFRANEDGYYQRGLKSVGRLRTSLGDWLQRRENPNNETVESHQMERLRQSDCRTTSNNFRGDSGNRRNDGRFQSGEERNISNRNHTGSRNVNNYDNSGNVNSRNQYDQYYRY